MPKTAHEQTAAVESIESIEHVDSKTTEVPVSKKQKFIAFLKKWWWALLIVNLALIFLVMMLMFFVAIPKIVQTRVNSSSLHVEAIKVVDVHTGNVTITIDSWIKASDSIHATIEPFAADLYLEDTPDSVFATLQMPQTKTGISIINVTQVLNVGDTYKQAFSDYTTALLTSESVKMTVKGVTYVHVQGIKRAYKATFKKTIELKGLNGFKGLAVSNGNVTTATTDNFVADVTIPNPSILSLEIGNATFINYFNGNDLGRLHIDNMNLVPGDNTFPVHATIDNGPILVALMTAPACNPGADNGVLAFELQGETVVNALNETLPYYETALAVAKQYVSINVGAAAEAGLGFNPSSKCSK